MFIFKLEDIVVNFSLIDSEPRSWKNSILTAKDNAILLINEPLNLYGKLVKFIDNLIYGDTSILKIRDRFNDQIEQLKTELPKLNLKERIKKVQHCNKNIQQLNEKIARHNHNMWFPLPKCPSIQLLSQPPLSPSSVQPITNVDSEAVRFNEVDLPDQTVKNDPDPEKLRNWVDHQHPAFQPFARELAQSIIDNYVDFPHFVKSLDETTALVEKKCGGLPFGAISMTNAGKSGYWVQKMVLFQSKPAATKSTLEFVEHASFNFNGKLSDKEKQIRDWVIIDDASYSATQIVEEILPYVLEGLIKNIPEGEIRLHFAIPFMTEFAENYLKNQALKDLEERYPKFKGCLLHRIKCLPSNTVRMVSIRQIADKLESDEDKDIALKFFQQFFLQWLKKTEKIATTFFAHKMGDNLSFTTFIKDGNIIDYNYKTEMFESNKNSDSPLPNIKPPYHKIK